MLLFGSASLHDIECVAYKWESRQHELNETNKWNNSNSNNRNKKNTATSSQNVMVRMGFDADRRIETFSCSIKKKYIWRYLWISFFFFCCRRRRCIYFQSNFISIQPIEFVRHSIDNRNDSVFRLCFFLLLFLFLFVFCLLENWKFNKAF